MLRSGFEHVILLVVLGLLGSAWIVYSREPVSQPRNFLLTEAPIVGHLAPDFILSTVEGEAYALKDLVDRDGDSGAGRPVILNFWASWCGPCRIETPHFQSASLKHNGRVAILGVNQGESAGIITDFGTSFGLTYPLLVDPENRVNDLYSIINLPTTVFIDRQGIVREVFVGVMNQAVLEERINRLLQEPG